MTRLGIGIVGGGYMGKAHAAAFAAVGTLFETALKPRLVAVCGSRPESGARHAQAYGFAKGAAGWQALVEDPEVEAVVIASPQGFHREIAEAAFALGKPVLCEKPMGVSVGEAEAMLAAAESAGVPHMVAYNYVRTPATRYARLLIEEGALGRVHHIRVEHTEDFRLVGGLPPWRLQGEAHGCLGDLAPHPINLALALGGKIAEVSAVVERISSSFEGHPVENDDQVAATFRFASGALGQFFASRVALGRKCGYAFEITGDKGAVRFDQEDQNALWFYEHGGPEARAGFRKILTGPAHPDYKAFCLGPGHGTGYQDQIVIEAKDFLTAIETGETVWPDFRDGLAVHRVIAAIREADASRGWVAVQA